MQVLCPIMTHFNHDVCSANLAIHKHALFLMNKPKFVILLVSIDFNFIQPFKTIINTNLCFELMPPSVL